VPENEIRLPKAVPLVELADENMEVPNGETPELESDAVANNTAKTNNPIRANFANRGLVFARFN
jgi:hypothetical protein